MHNKIMTKFEQKAVDDAAVAMFDFEVTQGDLIDHLEATARNLGCSVAELVACHLRSSLQVFSATPRERVGELDTMAFDLASARKELRKQSTSGRYLRAEAAQS